LPTRAQNISTTFDKKKRMAACIHVRDIQVTKTDKNYCEDCVLRVGKAMPLVEGCACKSGIRDQFVVVRGEFDLIIPPPRTPNQPAGDGRSGSENVKVVPLPGALVT